MFINFTILLLIFYICNLALLFQKIDKYHTPIKPDPHSSALKVSKETLGKFSW
jgi:hypothetical protein